MAAAYPPSYYAASANPFSRQPVLEGDLTADLVVVGGGYTGLSTALHAAQGGMSVILLEARQIGWGASGRNGGQMIPGLRWGAKDLVATLGEERARDLLVLANSAADKVRGLIARHGIACDQRDGHFLAAARPSHLDDMKRELDLLERLVGYPGGRIVERGGVGEFVASGGYHGGFYDAGGGHLHPLNYALGLADAALAAGVRVFEDSAVEVLEPGPQVRLRTAAGSVTAPCVVLATDTEIGELDVRQGRMTMPVGNYNVATAPLGVDRATAILPANAAVADSRFVLNYYRLSADNRLIFGGGEKYSPRPPADLAAFVRPYLEGVFPQLAGVPIEYAWGGLVGVSRNRLPRLGRQQNTFYAHGWSGHGVLLTTLAGELIARAVQGDTADFDRFASLPGKPFPGGAFLRHPLYVLGMLWFALRDRL